MAKGSPSLQTRAKRFGMIALASMGGLVVLNTAANRNIPVVTGLAKSVRNFVNRGV